MNPSINIPIKQYWQLLAKYLQPRRGRAIVLAILLFSSIGLELLAPQITRFFIDTATGQTRMNVADVDVLSTLLFAGTLYIVVAIVQQITRVGSNYVGQGVAWDATNDLRADLALHLLKLDLGFHNARTPGELIERVDGDVTQLSNFFSQFALKLLTSFATLAGVLVLMFIEDWRIGLALSLFAAIAIVLLARIGRLAAPRWQAEEQAGAEFYGFVGERLAGTEDIRSIGAVNYTLWRLQQKLRGWFPISFKAEIFGNFTWMTSLTLFAVADVTAFGTGAALFLSGAITLGTVYLIYEYVYSALNPIRQLQSQIDDLQRATASIVRVRELFETKSKIEDMVVHATYEKENKSVGLRFDHVTFGYGANEPVLHDISFELKPNEVLGLLGHTGSGKTTIARLLLRLYEARTGCIEICDHTWCEVRDIPLRELRQRIGLVTQDVQLFGASVRDNLTLFDKAIGDEQIMNALEKLGLAEWVRNLPNGLSTRLGTQGVGLSAGEAQLLAFARVFLRDPHVVILDEASSRLDPATERLIENAITQLLHDRIAIIIAHRLSTVMRADKIMVLNCGHVAEYGAREQLASDPASRFSQLLRTSEGILV